MRELMRNRGDVAPDLAAFAAAARRYRAAGSPIQPALVSALVARFSAARDPCAYVAAVADGCLDVAGGDARRALAALVERAADATPSYWLRRDERARLSGYPHGDAMRRARQPVGR